MALGLPAILVILENLSSAIFVPQRPSPLLSVLYPSETGIVPAVVLRRAMLSNVLVFCRDRGKCVFSLMSSSSLPTWADPPHKLLWPLAAHLHPCFSGLLEEYVISLWSNNFSLFASFSQSTVLIELVLLAKQVSTTQVAEFPVTSMALYPCSPLLGCGVLWKDRVRLWLPIKLSIKSSLEEDLDTLPVFRLVGIPFCLGYARLHKGEV